MEVETHIVKYRSEAEGTFNQYYTCVADDVDHAIEQFRNAYPAEKFDYEILTVFEVK